MKPILHNDGGVFRYTDFVGYIPDFLKTEDDVVTLLQVFSDYINNAYRNITRVEKFEFQFMASASNYEEVMKTVERFAELLRYSEGRSSEILFLSLPRNNAYDGTCGKYTHYPVTVSGEKKDSFSAARIGVPQNDGDVIYLKFTDGNVSGWPYHYDAASKMYYPEPEDVATSQDPFTGTANIPGSDGRTPRMLSFKASDIGTVGLRRTNDSDGNLIYAVYLQARITDVKSEDALLTVSADIDGFVKSGTNPVSNETVIVDYYGLAEEGGTEDAYSRISFSGKSFPTATLNGYSRGIFYFREATEDSLYTGTVSADCYTGLTDPIYSDAYSRWNIVSISPGASGTSCVFTMGTKCTMNPGDTFRVRIAEGTSLYTKSVFTVTECDGAVVTASSSIALTGSDGTLLPVPEKARACCVSLFFSRLSDDMSSYSARIRYVNASGLNAVDSSGSARCPAERDRFYAYSEIGNTVMTSVYGDKISTATLTVRIPVTAPFVNGCRAVIVPQADGSANPFLSLTPVVLSVRLDDSLNPMTENGFYVCDMMGVTSAQVNPSFSPSASLKYDIVGIRAGVAKVAGTLGASVSDTIVGTFVEIPESGDYVYLSAVGKTAPLDGAAYPVSAVTPTDDGYSVTLKGSVPTSYSDLLSVSILRKASGGDTFVVSSVNDAGSGVSWVTCSTYTGNIFSGAWFARDSDGTNPLILRNAYPVTDADSLSGNTAVIGGSLYCSHGVVYVANESGYFVFGATAVSASPMFSVSMRGFAVYSKTTVLNPYMFGLYPTVPVQYGSSADLSDGMSKVLGRVYVQKLEDVGLKYGWEAHQYIDYPNDVNMYSTGRDGYCEFYSLYDRSQKMLPGGKKISDDSYAGDIVVDDADSRCDAEIWYPMGLSGTKMLHGKHIAKAYANGGDGDYTVTFTFSDTESHGLADGELISICGFSAGDAAFNTPDGCLDTARVVDYRTITVTRSSVTAWTSPHPVATGSSEDWIVYGYRCAVGKVMSLTCSGGTSDVSIKVKTEHPMRIKAVDGDSGDVFLLMSDARLSALSCTPDYATMTLSGNYEISVTSDSEDDSVSLSAYGGTASVELPAVSVSSSDGVGYIFYRLTSGGVVQVAPATGMKSGYYRVQDGDWTEEDADNIIAPFTLFAKQNLFETTGDNPVYAYGDGDEIEWISYDGDSTVKVSLASAADYTAGSTYVSVSGVAPRGFCGTFVVDTVVSPRVFTYKVIPGSIGTSGVDGVAQDGVTMQSVPEKWYRYTVNGITWQRRSYADASKFGAVISSYSASGAGGYKYVYTTLTPTGLSAGDRVILCVNGSLRNAQVQYIVSDRSFTVVAGTSASVTVDPESENYVIRGIMLSPSCSGRGNGTDNLDSLAGEYTSNYLYSINSTYAFKAGDYVLLDDQILPRTSGLYRVVSGGSWTRVSRKRVMKLSGVSVEMIANPDYDPDDADSAEYIYAKYSDSGMKSYVSSSSLTDNVYWCEGGYVRGFNFGYPHVDGLDTTRGGLLDYSGKYDYNGVSPRSGMTDFQGVPDMKYPLAEKMERLAYLRDASVIDYDLIGYLARFMGYDVTTLREDIDDDSMYSLEKERVLAVRNAVENLPSFYSRGGTASGISMLLATFGIVADVVTLWTSTAHPYATLVDESSAADLQQDAVDAGKSGVWVSTPHIKVKIYDDRSFSSLTVTESGLKNIENQIRVFKPIQVVFDGIIKSIGLSEPVISVYASRPRVTGKMSFEIGYEKITLPDGSKADYSLDYYPEESVTNCLL